MTILVHKSYGNLEKGTEARRSHIHCSNLQFKHVKNRSCIVVDHRTCMQGHVYVYKYQAFLPIVGNWHVAPGGLNGAVWLCVVLFWCIPNYRQIVNIRSTKFQNLNVSPLVLQLSLSIYWIQVLSRKWRSTWSSADRRCSNCIWVINNFIGHQCAFYIRFFTVWYAWYTSSYN